MYNNYGFPYSMPTATQPYGVPIAPQMPAQQSAQYSAPIYPRNGQINILDFVNGEDGANAYILPPNARACLMDTNGSFFFWKISNATGQTTITKYAFGEAMKTEQQSKDEYALKSDLDALRKELETLKGSTIE